ncbi:MAG: hypothetical protein AAGD13_01015 [Pseudomonadota bacterium]
MSASRSDKNRGISGRTRRKRRAKAPELLASLEGLVHRTRINEKKGSHCTIWIGPEDRIEWWPGTQRWRDHNGAYHRGGQEALRRFIERVTPVRIERAFASHMADIRAEVL